MQVTMELAAILKERQVTTGTNSPQLPE